MANRSAYQYLLEIFSIFPIKFLFWLAQVLALLATYTPNSISRITEINIRLCLGHLTLPQQKDIAKASIRHTSYSLFELAAVWCWPEDKLLKKITREQLSEEFMQSQKGRLIIAPHIGSWELLGIRIARDNNLFSLYKPQENPKIDSFARQARSRNGAQLVPTDASGLRKLIKGLKQGATVIILPDQKPHRGKPHIDASFFGLVASTTPLIKYICERIDCDVFIGAMYRDEKSATFQLSIETLDHDSLADEEIKSAQYLNDQIETMVRSHPDQYQWSYKRFTPEVYIAS